MKTFITSLIVAFFMIMPGFASNFDISNFNLKAHQEMVEISWDLEPGEEEYVLIIEKSADAVSFTSIDTFYTGSGNVNYLCLDKTPFDGLSYYRLRCTKLNGEVVVIKLSYIEMYLATQNETFRIMGFYPMPFVDHVKLTIRCEDDIKLSIRCHDLDGKQLFEIENACTKGSNDFNFNEFVNLRNDTYYLTISDGYSNTKTIHFIKLDIH